MMSDNEKQPQPTDKKALLKKKLNQGSPDAWRRVIMAVSVALTGIVLIACVAISYVMKAQGEEYRRLPVVNLIENAKLPSGAYNIYQVYLDSNINYYFLVSDTRGGVVVSVKAPATLELPEDILEAEKYDAACYRIVVDSDGTWKFYESKAYKEFKKKLQARQGQENNEQAR